MQGQWLRRSVGTLAILVTAGLLSLPAAAQQRAESGQGGEGRDPLRVRRLEWRGNQAALKTPEYTTSLSRGVSLPGVWWVGTLSYDTSPDWVDEVSFQYYVMTSGEQDGKRVFSLFRGKVTYVDIEKGRDHSAEMFLSPKAIKRYGAPMAVAVEVTMGGQVIAAESESSMNMPA